MEKENNGKGAKTTMVVKGKRNEGGVLRVKGWDDFITLGGVTSTSLELWGNASQVGPGDWRDWRLGLLGEAAGNMRDGDINTNVIDSIGLGGGN
jgi:hypothetical protein